MYILNIFVQTVDKDAGCSSEKRAKFTGYASENRLNGKLHTIRKEFVWYGRTENIKVKYILSLIIAILVQEKQEWMQKIFFSRYQALHVCKDKNNELFCYINVKQK